MDDDLAAAEEARQQAALTAGGKCHAQALSLG